MAARLGVTRHFEDIFDIVSADLLPKPNAATYDRFIARFGIDPKRSVIFEDLARKSWRCRTRFGMSTVLVVPASARPVFLEDWELEGQDAAHVDYLTDNLADFLERVNATIAP